MISVAVNMARPMPVEIKFPAVDMVTIPVDKTSVGAPD